MNKTVSVFILTNLIVIALALEVEACSQCIYALYDRLLPPTSIWVVFSIVWPVSLSIFAKATKIRIWGATTPLKTILFILAFLILSMLTGPIFLFLLLIPCAVSIFQTYFINMNLKDSQRKKLRIFSLVWIICFLGIITNSIFIHYTRTPSTYILQWSNTYFGRRLLEGICRGGPKYLEDLRVIIRKGDLRSVAMASKGIVSYGNPENDVPLLITAFQRFHQDASFSSYRELFENNLSKITGLNLPEGSSPEMWKLH